MKARIKKWDTFLNFMIIEWKDDKTGFGELTFLWNREQQRYIVNSENMKLEHIIKVIKALPNKYHTPEQIKKLEDAGILTKEDYSTDIHFWKRLKSFVGDIEVSDAWGDEEKEMILNICQEKLL